MADGFINNELNYALFTQNGPIRRHPLSFHQNCIRFWLIFIILPQSYSAASLQFSDH